MKQVFPMFRRPGGGPWALERVELVVAVVELIVDCRLLLLLSLTVSYEVKPVDNLEKTN